MSPPRVALLGFSNECNRFAPVAREADTRARRWLEGEAIVADARAAAPGETAGFVAAMDARAPWEPRPARLAMARPNGPVEQGCFDAMMARWREGLRALRGAVEGACCVLHGAGLTTERDDPEGALQALARSELGEVRFVCSYDLHANLSDANLALGDAFVGHRTNPHLDMRERGAESAVLLRRLMAGERLFRAHRRLPIVAPTVSLLTAAGPYAEVIALGQARQAEDPRAAHVSVMAGLAYGDTPFNGRRAVVTATRQAAADELARAAWNRRGRFVARLTPLEEAVRMARDSPVPLALADVADNPGGGGLGNTTWLVRAFVEAGVAGAVCGVLHDPELAREAHALGAGSRFEARFNRGAGDDPFARPFTAPAEVRALPDGDVTGRRGIFAGTRMRLGKTAWLRIGCVDAAVMEGRTQRADPAVLEHLGMDLRAARAVVVKSRGHFRGGFDEFFGPDRIVEVDAPGLTSRILSRFDRKRLPRPVLPLDTETTWA